MNINRINKHESSVSTIASLLESTPKTTKQVSKLAQKTTLLVGLVIGTTACLEEQENTRNAIMAVYENDRTDNNSTTSYYTETQHNLREIQPPQGIIHLKMNDNRPENMEAGPERIIKTHLRDPYNSDIFYSLEVLADTPAEQQEYTIVYRDFSNFYPYQTYATGQGVITGTTTNGFMNLIYDELNIVQMQSVLRVPRNSTAYERVETLNTFYEEEIYPSGIPVGAGIIDGYVIYKDSSMSRARVYAIDPITHKVHEFNITQTIPQSVHVAWAHQLDPSTLLLKTNSEILLAKGAEYTGSEFQMEFYRLDNLINNGFIQIDPLDYDTIAKGSCEAVFCNSYGDIYMITLEEGAIIDPGPGPDPEREDAAILDSSVGQDASTEDAEINDAGIDNDAEIINDSEISDTEVIDSTTIDSETSDSQIVDSQLIDTSVEISDSQIEADSATDSDGYISGSKPDFTLTPGIKLPRIDSGVESPSNSSNSGCSTLDLSNSTENSQNNPTFPILTLLGAAAIANRSRKILK